MSQRPVHVHVSAGVGDQLSPEQLAQLQGQYAARGARFIELARQDQVLGATLAQVEAYLPAMQMPLRLAGLSIPANLDGVNPMVVAVFADAIARTWTASQS